MKASQLVDDLQSMIAHYGDIEVVMEDDSSPVVEYYNDSGDEPVLVIA